MLTDPIADMLTRVRNANTAKHDEVRHALVQAEGRTRRGPPQGGLHRELRDRTVTHAVSATC